LERIHLPRKLLELAQGSLELSIEEVQA